MEKERIKEILNRVPRRQGKRNSGEPYNRYKIVKDILKEETNIHFTSNQSIRYLDQLFSSDRCDADLLMEGYLKYRWKLKTCIRVLKDGYLLKECEKNSELINKIRNGNYKSLDKIIWELTKVYHNYNHYIIYFLGFTDPNTNRTLDYYKFGLTKNLEGRLMDYEINNPHKTFVIKTWSFSKEDCFKIEKEIKGWATEKGILHKNEFIYCSYMDYNELLEDIDKLIRNRWTLFW